MRAPASTGTDRRDAFGRYGRIRLFGCRSRRPPRRKNGGDRQPAPGRCERTSGRPGGLLRGDRRSEGRPRRCLTAAFEWLRAAGAHSGVGPDERRTASHPSLHHRGLRSRAVPFRAAQSSRTTHNCSRAAGFSPQHTWFSVDVSSDQPAPGAHQPADAAGPEQAANASRRSESNSVDRPAVLQRLLRAPRRDVDGPPRLHLADFEEFVELFAPALSLMTAGDIHIAAIADSGATSAARSRIRTTPPKYRALNGDATCLGPVAPERHASPATCAPHDRDGARRAREPGCVGVAARQHRALRRRIRGRRDGDCGRGPGGAAEARPGHPTV